MTYFNVIKYCKKFKHVVTLHEEKKKNNLQNVRIIFLIFKITNKIYYT